MQKQIIVAIKRILTEHSREQEAGETSRQLHELADRQARNLQNGIELGRMTAGAKPQNFEALYQAQLETQRGEQAAIADELVKIDIDLLPATTFLEDSLARPGLIAGPKLSPRQEHDVELGWDIAKEIARLDIGQTIVIKNGTIVAVEALEGTNEAITRGGTLARDGAVVIKVSKPNQDMRFDVPVIGVETVRIAAQSGVRVVAVEAGKTLLLERDAVIALANGSNVSVVAR